MSGDLRIDPPMEVKKIFFLNDSHARPIERIAPVPRARGRFPRTLPFHDTDLFPQCTFGDGRV